jgi:anti-sigma factor RsiW
VSFMKPCSRNRKPLAWLALGELEARRAARLRAHMETCDGCRRYLAEISAVTEKLAAAEKTPDIYASEAFHRRLVTRLGTEQSGSVWHTLAASLLAARLNWRVALPVVGAAALVILVLSIPVRQPAAPPPVPTGVQAVLPPVMKSDMPPTIANYQRIAARSLDELDELLTRQGKRSSSPTPIYTASMFAAASTAN